MAEVTLGVLEEASGLLNQAMALVAEVGPRCSVPLQDSALTLAALERALTVFAHRLLGDASGPGPDPSLHCLDGALAALRHKQATLTPLAATGGVGGADSMLFYLSQALATTVKCLTALKPRPLLGVPERVHRALVGLVTLLGATVLALVRRHPKRFGRGRGAGRACVAVGMAYLAVRRAHSWVVGRTLEGAQQRLITVLKLWVIVDYVLLYAKLRKDTSVDHVTLIARPHPSDHDPMKRWKSRRMLEQVPPHSDTAFWYQASPATALFRYSMNTVYASFDAGSRVSASMGPDNEAWAWPLLGLPATVLAGFYYALRPSEASRASSVATSQGCTLPMLRRAWGSADWGPMRAMGSVLGRLQGLTWQRRVKVGGVSCYLFSRHKAGPPKGEEGARVLLFVHGGGFIAHLFLPDMPVLAQWAKDTECDVVVVPEYTLLPEGQYPKPRDEVLAVYKALLQGEVGFRPSRIAVAGESAGGNLAASLVVSILMELDCCEGCGAPGNTGQPSHQPSLAYKAMHGSRSAVSLAEEGNNKNMDMSTELAEGTEECKVTACCSSGKARSGSSLGRTESKGSDTDYEDPSSSSSSSQDGQQQHLDLRVPDTLTLFYPVLNFCLAPSPARAMHMADPVLPIGVVCAITEAYLPTGTELQKDPSKDPRLAPYFAHERLVRRFPPTFLGVGGFDPLLDDAVDFEARLRRLGVPCEVRVGRDLPHGFFGLYGVDKTATTIINEAAHFMRQGLQATAPPSKPEHAETGPEAVHIMGTEG